MVNLTLLIHFIIFLYEQQVPFGSGPRNCIGSRFALMEVKVNLYYLLKNYKLEVNAQTQIPMIMKTSPFGMYPEKGLNVNLVPRYK